MESDFQCDKMYYVAAESAWILENIIFSRYCNIIVNKVVLVKVGGISNSSSDSLC